MALPDHNIAASTEVVARLLTCASALKIDASPLIDACANLSSAAGSYARVITDDSFRELALVVERPPDKQRIAERSDAQRFLEVRQVNGAVIEVEHVFGRAQSSDVDLAVLVAGHVEPWVVAELRRRLGELAGDARNPQSNGYSLAIAEPRFWAIHSFIPTSRDREDALTGLLVAAALSKVTEPQRDLLAQVHPVLCGRGAVVSLRAARDSVFPEIRVSYGDVPMTAVLRLVTGIFPDGAHASKLGALAGAFNADRAASFELVLGSREPVSFRMAVDMVKGRPA